MFFYFLWYNIYKISSINIWFKDVIHISTENKGTDSTTKPPQRRLYFPTYGSVFPLWMCHEIICKEFLRLFIYKGIPVASISKPKKEVVLDLKGKIRGVRFDVITETGAGRESSDYHIYCIDAQRDFLIKSFADRNLYYGCVAVAAKSLDKT